MRDIILLGAGIVAVLTAVAKLVQARRAWTPTVLYLCGAIAGIGVSAALVAPVTLTWFSTWEPMTNLGRLVANVSAMAGAVCVQGLLAHLVHGDPARTRRFIRLQVAIFVVAAAAMSVLMASVSDLPFTTYFVGEYAGVPAVAAYGAVFSCHIGWAEVTLGWFLRPYIARTTRPWLRAGLRTVQVSTYFGVGWAVSKIVASSVALAGGDPAVWDPVAGILAGICVLLMGVGATMPVWGPVVAAPVVWLRTSWLLRRLRPLWTRLSDAVPQVKLPSRLIAPRNAQFTLYRRVVEVRDAQLVLRPYVHPDIGAWTRQAATEAGLDERRVHQLVEAAGLASALDAQASDHRYRTESDGSDTPFRDIGSDPQAEARWLIAVSDALRSPIVDRARNRARADLAS